MPEDTWAKFTTLGLLAGLIGLGKDLRGTHPMTIRTTLGRIITSAGLGGTASFLPYFNPEVPLYVQMGLACGLATLGTDVITELLRKKLGVN